MSTHQTHIAHPLYHSHTFSHATCQPLLFIELLKGRTPGTNAISIASTMAELNQEFKTALRQIIRDEVKKVLAKSSSATSKLPAHKTRTPHLNPKKTGVVPSRNNYQIETLPRKDAAKPGPRPQKCRDAGCQPIPGPRCAFTKRWDWEHPCSIPRHEQLLKDAMNKDMLWRKETIMKFTGICESSRGVTVIRCPDPEDLQRVFGSLDGAGYGQCLIGGSSRWSSGVIFLECDFDDHSDLLIKVRQMNVRAYTYRVELEDTLPGQQA